MAPIEIDGTDITGATIDGTDVQEITVDGQTVFSAGPASGSKIFIIEDGTDEIFSFDLTPAHDITNRSNKQTINTDRDRPHGITFNNDTGLRFWVTYLNSGQIDQYDTNTPFVLQKTNQTTFSAPDGISGINFDPDGSRFFVTQHTADQIREYSVSANFDIGSTVTLQNTISTVNFPRAMTFSADGLTLFVQRFRSEILRQSTLGNPFDITDIISNQDFTPGDLGLPSRPEGVEISNDGLNFYTAGGNTLSHFELNTPNDLNDGFTQTSQSFLTAASDLTIIR
jgi:DNA-binding beta-propeller fold protein YncE